MQIIPPDKCYFCPTLHREPNAYLPAYHESFRRARHIVYLTRAERRFAERLHGHRPGTVVGIAIETPDLPMRRPTSPLPESFLLYAGRIEPAKGLPLLFHHFFRFKATNPCDLKLVLMGKKSMAVPDHPDILELGFCDDDEKLAVMSQALALVQPSSFESFSIVLLESMSVGTPVLANAQCPALAEHVRNSGGGFCFRDDSEFAHALRAIQQSPEVRGLLGQHGRRYVQRNFTESIVTDRLRSVFQDRVDPFRSQIVSQNAQAIDI